MMPALRAPRRGLRGLRATAVALLPLAAVTCLNDRPVGPGNVAKATLRLGRVARASVLCAPAPPITLRLARAVLHERGRTDSTVAIAQFVGDTSSLSIDLPLAGDQALFDIDAQTVDGVGDTVFRARDSVLVRAGAITTVASLQLWYSAPDSGLAVLALAPRDTSALFLAQFPMRALGLLPTQQLFSGVIRLGFVSRDPAIAAVSPSGVVTLGSTAGFTWIVANTWLGLCDSTTVTAFSPLGVIVPSALPIGP